MLVAVTLAVLASTLSNVGKALQREGARRLPRLTLWPPRILSQYIRDTSWRLGTLLDLLGGLLMVLAVARGHVSVTQPAAGFGLVALALYSHIFLGERLRPPEMLAAIAVALGTIGVGVTANEDGADASGATRPPHVHVTLTLLRLALLIVANALMVWYLQDREVQNRAAETTVPAPAPATALNALSPGVVGPVTSTLSKNARADAIVCGITAGSCFGLSASLTRGGLVLAVATNHRAWYAVGFVLSVAHTATGFAAQTRAFRDGGAVVVGAVASASTVMTGIVVGVLALGEPLPSGWAQCSLLMMSWLLVMAGVAVLSIPNADTRGRMLPPHSRPVPV